MDGFDIPEFFDKLNEVEGLVDAEHKWGGGTTCGGPPRKPGGMRSSLKLQTVIETMDKVILEG